MSSLYYEIKDTTQYTAPFRSVDDSVSVVEESIIHLFQRGGGGDYCESERSYHIILDEHELNMKLFIPFKIFINCSS